MKPCSGDGRRGRRGRGRSRREIVGRREEMEAVDRTCRSPKGHGREIEGDSETWERRMIVSKETVALGIRLGHMPYC